MNAKTTVILLVLLILGLLFRNPIMPTVAVLIWESILVFLPAILKKVSVIFYLESLCPVQAPFRGGGALTSSQTVDAQAAYEAAMTLWPTFLAGTNFVMHSAGWLESGLVSC